MWKCKSLIASPVSITIMQNYFVLEQYGKKTIMQSHWKTVIRLDFLSWKISTISQLNFTSISYVAEAHDAV